MQPDEVARSYDTLASLWDSDRFPRENGIEQHRRALQFCRARGRAIDIGCGSSGRIIDLLLEAGFDVEGLDISEQMLERAQARHPALSFHLVDVRQWQPNGSYDFISAWDSIWHVPLADQRAVLAKLLGTLSVGGVCIFTLGGLAAPSEKTDNAMGPDMYHATLGITETLKVLNEAGCICRHLEYDQHPEPHAYIIAQR